MDDQGAPLKMTKTLGPAIGFVAETAGGLIQEGEDQQRRMKEAKSTEQAASKKAEKETARWVLGAPGRLEKLVADRKKDEADRDWAEVKNLLDKWGEVKGISEVRDACTKVMEGKEDKGF